MIKLIYIIITICLVSVNYLSAQSEVELLGQLNPYPNLAYTDIWGYAANGREYALMGVSGGTSIIDVTDPANPVEVDFISGPAAPPYEWRDIKTHLNYAYVVTEGTGSGQGLQIIDLSNLPTSASLVNTIDTWFSRAHDIFIDNGYAYVVGTNGGGGMHILDLSDPINPTETAYYTASGYIHDLYVWNDTAVVCAGNTYDLVDVSNKNNPQFISASTPISGIYAHSGWMTEDKRYFFGTEEGNQVDITVWDLQDRTSWDLVVSSWETNSGATVHNLFIQGNYAHVSYYVDGYVVLDISDPTNPVLAGQYDTYPGTGGPFKGAWGVYPYLPSGFTIVSDIETGLYVLKFDIPTAVVDEELPISFSLNQNYPNPFNPSTTISFSIPEPGLVTLKVYSILGEVVAELLNEFKEAGIYEIKFSADNLPAGRQGLTSGIYIAKLSTGNNIQTIKMSLLK